MAGTTEEEVGDQETNTGIIVETTTVTSIETTETPTGLNLGLGAGIGAIETMKILLNAEESKSLTQNCNISKLTLGSNSLGKKK